MKTYESANDLKDWLEAHPDWSFEDDKIAADFKFIDFTEAFAFLAVVGQFSERDNHHAKIENTYNRVRLTLTTHDAGNKVTDKDLKLADQISAWKAGT